MQITQCLHAAVLVSELENAEQFYSNVLGLPKVERPLKYRGGWYQVGEFQVHLIEHPNFRVEPPNYEKLGRNPHIALGVANVEEAKERLQAHGHPTQMSASGRAALFTQDPDGNIIEMTQV